LAFQLSVPEPGVVSDGTLSLSKPSSRLPNTFQTSMLRRDWNLRM